jgi:hypothetical protein
LTISVAHGNPSTGRSISSATDHLAEAPIAPPTATTTKDRSGTFSPISHMILVYS